MDEGLYRFLSASDIPFPFFLFPLFPYYLSPGREESSRVAAGVPSHFPFFFPRFPIVSTGFIFFQLAQKGAKMKSLA